MVARILASAAMALLALLALAALSFGWTGSGGGGKAGKELISGAHGAMRISGSGGDRAILRGADLAPGKVTTGGVTIRNAGSGPGTVVLSRQNLRDQPGLGGGLLSAALELTVRDVTSRSDAIVYSGRLGAMPRLRVAYLDPAAARRYRFEARLPDPGPDNSLEAAVATFDYRWAILGTPPRPCQLAFRGDPGPNRLVGTAGGDRISGFGGRDRLFGGPGDDCLRGGSGRDALDCGAGEDVAYVDRLDVSRGCERVIRAG